jgi:hypothetical protein
MEPKQPSNEEPLRSVDYLDLFPRTTQSDTAITKKLYNEMREMVREHMIPTGYPSLDQLIPAGGFKRGDLTILFGKPVPPYEQKSNLFLHTALRLMKERPDIKIVWPVSPEMDPFDEERFNASLEALGIERTDNKDIES